MHKKFLLLFTTLLFIGCTDVREESPDEELSEEKVSIQKEKPETNLEFNQKMTIEEATELLAGAWSTDDGFINFYFPNGKYTHGHSLKNKSGEQQIVGIKGDFEILKYDENVDAFIVALHSYEDEEPNLFTISFEDKGDTMNYGVVEENVVVKEFIKERVEVDQDRINFTDQGRTEAVVAESTEPTSQETENVSQEFENALIKGQRYAERQNMSKKRVYKQLTSEYGEHFSKAAADYAIERIEVDWNQNALYKAKRYYERQNMSKERIYTQLVSEHGEEFTEEQAQFAIDNLE